jgi:integrase/recombinase XerD
VTSDNLAINLEDLPVDKIQPKKKGKSKTTPLTTEEVQKMIRAAWTNDRDLLCLLLLRDTGGRINEIKNICPQHIDWKERRIWVPTAKNDGTGYLHFTEETEKELAKWIEKQKIRTDKPLWGKTSKRTLQRLPERYAFKIGLWNPLEKVGKRPSCHSFRAHFCTMMIDAGMPEIKTQRMMRHKSLSTTELYYKSNPGVEKEDYDRVLSNRLK